MFRRSIRLTHFDTRVESQIDARLEDAQCDRLDDVLRPRIWILERQPDNDRAVDLGDGSWLIKTEALPGLESPAVTLVYRFDDANVWWWGIRIECDVPDVAGPF